MISENGVALGAKVVTSMEMAVTDDNNSKSTKGITAATGEHEEWNSNSGATEQMISDATAFEHYKSAARRTMVKIADGTFLQVADFGKLVVSLMK